jgi:acyl-coenzyme A thioesterase PaaI-like protein
VSEPAAPPMLPSDHFVPSLGVALSHRGDNALGHAEVHPEMCAPGTRDLRVGILATMVDLVAGHCPLHAINPTVDLRVSVVAPLPADGPIVLVARPLKVGNRLVVAETTLATAEDRPPFALATTTFINRPFPEAGGLPPSQRIGHASYDEYLRARHLGGGVIEVDPIPELANGPARTIQGGVQAFAAEVATHRAAAETGDGPVRTVDLHIRYLNPLRHGGPMLVTPTVVPGVGSLLHASIAMTEASTGDVVSHATITLATVAP